MPLGVSRGHRGHRRLRRRWHRAGFLPRHLRVYLLQVHLHLPNNRLLIILDGLRVLVEAVLELVLLGDYWLLSRQAFGLLRDCRGRLDCLVVAVVSDHREARLACRALCRISYDLLEQRLEIVLNGRLLRGLETQGLVNQHDLRDDQLAVDVRVMILGVTRHVELAMALNGGFPRLEGISILEHDLAELSFLETSSARDEVAFGDRRRKHDFMGRYMRVVEDMRLV